MGFLNSSSTFASAILTLIGLINMLVSVLGALALVLFFIGLVRYVRDSADAKGHAEGRERIIWSLIALFILFSIWGILNILSISFFGSTSLNGSGSTTGQQNSNQYPVSPSFGGYGAQPY